MLGASAAPDPNSAAESAYMSPIVSIVAPAISATIASSGDAALALAETGGDRQRDACEEKQPAADATHGFRTSADAYLKSNHTTQLSAKRKPTVPPRDVRDRADDPQRNADVEESVV